MLDFSDRPYQFFPPQPKRMVSWCVELLNRQLVLPGKKHRIARIELCNAERVLPIIQSGARCLLLPNHSTHSDPQLMLEVQRRLRLRASTMAAYDVFLRGKLQAWIMQSIGCFSVDREGSDKQAMNCAIEVLVRGQRGLTIFPEGNVILMNDRVAPFLGGAAFIAMRAQKKLGADKPIYALPVSLKYSHLTECQATIEGHMDDLESQLSIEASDNATFRKRLRNIGIQVLTRNLRQRGFMEPGEEEKDLNAMLAACATQIIETLKQKMELTAKNEVPPIERIRSIRAGIHQIRIDENQKLDHRVASSWADEAILAVRILSYCGNYLRDSPTLDRHSETLEKLREDLAETILPPIGPRAAFVHFNEPINLAEYLGAKNSRQALADLTSRFEESVQSGIDEINAENELPGAKVLE